MQRGYVPSLLLALSLLFGACDEASVSVYDTPQEKTPVGIPATHLPWFMGGFSLLDEQTEELAVGMLAKADGSEIGSAVLVAPNVFITAGHCMEDGDAALFVVGCESYKIVDYRMHPKYKIGDRLFQDAAVGLLERNCPVTPVPIMGKSNRYIQGESLTLIGFGGGYKRRSNPDVFWYYGTLIEEPTVFKMLPINGTLYFGDSGGAVLNSRGVLVGIISSLAVKDSTIYENSATRVDLVAEWVRAVVLELSGNPL